MLATGKCCTGRVFDDGDAARQTIEGNLRFHSCFLFQLRKRGYVNENDAELSKLRMQSIWSQRKASLDAERHHSSARNQVSHQTSLASDAALVFCFLTRMIGPTYVARQTGRWGASTLPSDNRTPVPGMQADQCERSGAPSPGACGPVYREIWKGQRNTYSREKKTMILLRDMTGRLCKSFKRWVGPRRRLVDA